MYEGESNENLKYFTEGKEKIKAGMPKFYISYPRNFGLLFPKFLG